MGGSSAQPSDIAGKYRPSQAAVDLEKQITLNMAARDIRDIGSFMGKIRKTGRTGTEIERKYSMDLLNTLEERIKPSLMNGNINQAKALIKRLRITLTNKGYCLEFGNDLMLLDAFVTRMRKDFERDHPINLAWHCGSCGNDQYKLLGGQKQCQACFELEKEN